MLRNVKRQALRSAISANYKTHYLSSGIYLFFSDKVRYHTTGLESPHLPGFVRRGLSIIIPAILTALVPYVGGRLHRAR